MAHVKSALAPLVLALVYAGWLSATVKEKAADYLVHSIPAHSQTFFAADYLVVDVAVFPSRLEPVEIGTNTFTLRINGRKEVIFPDSPGFVAASLTYPDWEQHRRGTVSR